MITTKTIRLLLQFQPKKCQSTQIGSHELSGYFLVIEAFFFVCDQVDENKLCAHTNNILLILNDKFIIDNIQAFDFCFYCLG